MKRRVGCLLLGALLLLGACCLGEEWNGYPTAVVRGGTAILREGPSQGARIVRSLPVGTVLVLPDATDTSLEWVRVYLHPEGLEGFVPGASLAPLYASGNYRGVVISESVTLRTEPRISADRILSIRNGESFTVWEESNGWYFVEYWNEKLAAPQQGWLLSDYVVQNPRYLTLEQSVYAYAAPNRSGKRVGQLPKGTELVIIDEWGDFYVVNLRSAIAYIYKRDVGS